MARDQPLQLMSFGRPLAGMVHEPAGERREPCAVFCNPFGDERRSSCLAMTRLARGLAQQGWPVLRFDYWGCGESPGDSAQATVLTGIEDVRSAAVFLRARTGCRSVCLLGLRLGATMAVQAAQRMPECSALALVEPVSNGASYVRNELRRRQVRRMITTGGGRPEAQHEAPEVVDLDGYAVSRRTLGQIQELAIARGRVAFDGRVLVVQASFTERLRPDTAAVRDAFAEAGAQVTVQAVVLPPFWSRVDIVDATPLTEAVTGWLSTLRRD